MTKSVVYSEGCACCEGGIEGRIVDRNNPTGITTNYMLFTFCDVRQ